jgi:hypothetical protein
VKPKIVLRPQHDFFRRPHWRWLRVQLLLADDQKPNRKREDEWIHAAYHALKDGGSATDRVVLTAHEVWCGDVEVRHELEAWLLTTTSFQDIANRLGLSVEVVGAYESIFFAVREAATATDWLVLRAVGYSAVRGFVQELPYAMWKLVALHGGAFILEVVIAATTGRPLPPGAVRRSGNSRAAAEAMLRLKVKLLVTLMSTGSANELARVSQALREIREQKAIETGLPAVVAPGQLAAEEFLLSLPTLIRKSKLVVPNSKPPRRRRQTR